MIRFLLAIPLFVLLATPASAFAMWKAVPDPHAITWSGTQGDNVLSGGCTDFNANIVFDPADLATASVIVRIDIATCRTGDTKKDAYLRQNVWFDVAGFPRATFEARHFQHVTGDDYIANGTLTLKGVTRPVTMPFTLSIDGDTAHVVGTTTLQRLAFGIGEGPQLSPPTVAGPDVIVKIDLKATRK
jgi:polyisoprenoid-binding protein YceI